MSLPSLTPNFLVSLEADSGAVSGFVHGLRIFCCPRYHYHAGGNPSAELAALLLSFVGRPV